METFLKMTLLITNLLITNLLITNLLITMLNKCSYENALDFGLTLSGTSISLSKGSRL